MKIQKKKTSLVIIPESDLVASQVEALRDAILKKMKKETDIERIVLDVKGIEVVDSLGVNLIIGTYRQSESESKQFEVINANTSFLKLSAFFKFNEFFAVSPEKT